MVCDRCGGKGIFYTRVHNGVPIPAIPDNGVCYRCLGSGIDPHLIDKTDIAVKMGSNKYTKEKTIQLVIDLLIDNKIGDVSSRRKIACAMLNKMYKNNDILECPETNHWYINMEKVFNEYTNPSGQPA